MRVGSALAVTWLLVLCLPEAAGKRSRGAKQANSRKRECERDVCGDVHEDYRTNCVLKCQSEVCYAEVYGQEELEPGEIDTKRQREFSQCQSRVAREAKRSKVKGQTGAGGRAQEAPTTQEQSDEDSRADADARSEGDVDAPSEGDAPTEGDAQPEGDSEVQVEL